MARTRSVRADDFLDEALGAEDFPVEGQLLRLGLNILADREGRLEDRPKRIAAQLFPYRTVDVDGLLDMLEAAGSIRRYAIGEQSLIQLVGFVEQQNPHPNEARSRLPPPPLQQGGSATPARETSGSFPKPRDGSPPLSPDLCSLISDPLISVPGDPPPVTRQAVLVAVPPTWPRPEDLQACWNEVAALYPELSAWRGMSEARRRSAKAALEACPEISRWTAFLRHTLAKPFYRGLDERTGERVPGAWVADVDWLLRKGRRDKVQDFDPTREDEEPPSGATGSDDGIPF
jgi:hypothetical protein